MSEQVYRVVVVFSIIYNCMLFFEKNPKPRSYYLTEPRFRRRFPSEGESPSIHAGFRAPTNFRNTQKSEKVNKDPPVAVISYFRATKYLLSGVLGRYTIAAIGTTDTYTGFSFFFNHLLFEVSCLSPDANANPKSKGRTWFRRIFMANSASFRMIRGKIHG